MYGEAERAQAPGGPWTVRWGRRAVAGAVLAATIALGAAPVADADSCPVIGVVGCPGPQPGPTPPPTPTTTSTTVAPAPTTPVPPSTTTTTSTTMLAEPTPAQARARLVELVNSERVQRGLQPLAPRDDVTDIAMRWSESMAQAGELSHNDAYFSKESRRRLGARVLGENVARDSTIDHAHQALMASEHHRDNILDARFSVIGFGAVFREGSWWVTEDFLQSRSSASPAQAPALPNAGGRGVERARGAGAPTPAKVQVNAASASNEVLAAVAPAEQAALVPTTVPPPVVSTLAGEALPSRPRRFAAVAVALLLVVSVVALRKAMRRAARLTDPGQLGMGAAIDEMPELVGASA